MADVTKHNGGPPDAPLTPKAKLECIRSLIEREDITAQQKCVGTMMVLQADKDWSSEVRTGELQRAASVKDRETVFRATRRLDQLGVIAKASARGQAGKYTVLPPRIMQAVIEAYSEAKTGRVKADQSEEKKSVETGRHIQSEPTTIPVGFDPTTSEQSAETGRLSSDQSSSRAYKELPSEVVITSEEKKEREVAQGEIGLLATNSEPIESPVDRAFRTYNELATRVHIPKARGLAPDRRRTIAARIKENGGWEAWELFLANIERSAFLQGRNDRNWIPPGLDWLLEPKHFRKVIEGGYGNGAHAAQPKNVDRREREANEARVAAQGWVIPNQGVTRE